MNVDLPQMLATRADAIDPPRVDPRDVVARGERLVRRRRRRAAVGAACALALAIGGTTLALDASDDQTSPVRPTDPTKTTPEGARPLSYGQGQVLHLGGRQIDTGLDFLSLDVTDDGAALTTLDGAIWFTDGTEVEQVGATLGGRVTGSGVAWDLLRPHDWVVNDSSGSLLAWLEYPAPGKGMPELVVYDSSRRAVVARQQVAVGDNRDRPVVIAVAGLEVFVSLEHTEQLDDTLLRYTLGSGVLEPVDAEVFEAATRGVPRALVIGPSAEISNVVGSAERVPKLHSDYDTFDVIDSKFDGLFNAHTGFPLELRVPDGYDFTRIWFVQWLDNDQFTVIAGSTPKGDLLVCQIAAERCRVVIEAEDSAPRDSTSLLPGEGGVGAEYALIRARAAALK